VIGRFISDSQGRYSWNVRLATEFPGLNRWCSQYVGLPLCLMSPQGRKAFAVGLDSYPNLAHSPQPPHSSFYLVLCALVYSIPSTSTSAYSSLVPRLPLTAGSSTQYRMLHCSNQSLLQLNSPPNQSSRQGSTMSSRDISLLMVSIQAPCPC